jgi:hypothetical protein
MTAITDLAVQPLMARMRTLGQGSYTESNWFRFTSRRLGKGLTCKDQRSLPPRWFPYRQAQCRTIQLGIAVHRAPFRSKPWSEDPWAGQGIISLLIFPLWFFGRAMGEGGSSRWSVLLGIAPLAEVITL